jgi:monoamine oxidase
MAENFFMNPPEVAVIGGGIAGLNATRELAERGARVELFEGANRLGGHMQTVLLGETPVEQGGEIIDSSDATILSLARKYGIEMRSRYPDATREKVAYFANGTQVPQEELNTAYATLAPRIAAAKAALRDTQGGYTAEAAAFDAMSADAFLDQIGAGVDPRLLAVIKAAHRSDNGRDTDELSALALLEAMDANASEFKPNSLEEDLTFAYGTQKLLDALERDVGQRNIPMNRGAKLIEVDARGKRIRLVFERQMQGRMVKMMKEVDQVVLAMPLHQLRDVKGIETLGLSPQQMALIEDGGYANLVKVTFATKGEPWKKIPDCSGEITGAGSMFQQSWGTEGTEGAQSTVTMLIGGTAADLPKAELMARCRADYAAALGMKEDEVFAQPEPISLRDWRQNPCYASPAKGQYIAYAQFGRPGENPNVAFAGSYMPTEGKIGYMENGAASGARAAELLSARWAAREEETPKKRLFPVLSTTVKAVAVGGVAAAVAGIVAATGVLALSGAAIAVVGLGLAAATVARDVWRLSSTVDEDGKRKLHLPKPRTIAEMRDINERTQEKAEEQTVARQWAKRTGKTERPDSWQGFLAEQEAQRGTKQQHTLH